MYDTYLLTYLPTRIRGLAMFAQFAECLAVEFACGDQRRLAGSGSALEAPCDDALYIFTSFYFYFIP